MSHMGSRQGWVSRLLRRPVFTPKPLHRQYPDLMCQVCAGAGNVYQAGHVIQCHLCGGKGITDVPRDGYGDPA